MKSDASSMQAKGRLGRCIAGMLAIVFSLGACSSARRSVSLDVVTFNYLDRFIFDVFIDGKSGDSSTPYPETGGSTITGVKLREGPKQVTWILGGGGERQGTGKS